MQYLRLVNVNIEMNIAHQEASHIGDIYERSPIFDADKTDDQYPWSSDRKLLTISSILPETFHLSVLKYTDASLFIGWQSMKEIWRT